MDIVGVESVIYGAEDVVAATKFHEDWGLELVGKWEDGANFKLPDNTTVQIRRINDPDLPPPSVPGSTAREVIWGVKTKKSLKAIGDELSSDRDVTTDDEGGLHSHDDLGYRIGFKLTARKPKPAKLPKINTVWTAPRVNKRAELSSLASNR